MKDGDNNGEEAIPHQRRAAKRTHLHPRQREGEGDDRVRRKARNATISRTFLDLFRDEYLRIEREQMERDSPTVQELRRIRSEIWHIGHNINQIARLTNTNSVPPTRT